MMKFVCTIVAVVALITQPIYAQVETDYTYISDRKFFVPNDLIGYDFRPQAMEIRGEREKKLSPGEYSFGVSMNNLYVDGANVKGVYSVNNINPTEYGYKLTLMNARDPRIQGHLKVMLNKKAQVEALVFKRSNKDPEMIFYQAFMKDKKYNQEKAFFTDRHEIPLTQQDTIWGKELYPFLRIHYDQGAVQERLQMEDSTRIEFVEKITVIEKKKKKRKKRKKKKKKKKGEEAEEEVDVEELETEIKEADPGAMPPVEEAESLDEAMEEEPQEEVVKVKIVKEYFVKVRSILTYDDGTTEDKTWEYPVKDKIRFFETQSSDPMVEPFEMEIPTSKRGEPVVLFISKHKTISAVLIEGKKYLMRGY